MAIKHRSIIAQGGPDLNQSGWWDMGEALSFAAFSNSTTATILPIAITAFNTTSSATGVETLPFNAGIYRLQGAQLAFMAAGTAGGLAASSISTLGIAVYRAFGELNAQITNAGGALTSLAIAAPGVNTAMPSGQTFTLTTAAGATPQVWTTSAAVAVGALTIPVTSTTPSATYAAGTDLNGQVGNNILFGWLNGAGGGSMAFGQNESNPLPAITATFTAAGASTTGDPYGPYLVLMPGDIVALYGITSSSTFSVPAGIIATMGV
jgi:hypothetical protein